MTTTKDEFERRGYVVIRGLLGPTRLLAIAARFSSGRAWATKISASECLSVLTG